MFYKDIKSISQLLYEVVAGIALIIDLLKNEDEFNLLIKKVNYFK